MVYRMTGFILMIGVLLSACGSAVALPTSQPPAPTQEVQPSVLPTDTLQPTESLATTSVPTSQPATASPLPATEAPTQAPTEPPEATATTPASPTADATADPTAIPQTLTASPSTGEAILFLRGGNLWQYDVASQQEAQLVEQVRDVVPSRDGSLLALLRGSGNASEIWIAQRDGSELRQITNNDVTESRPDWAPDNAALVYAASPVDEDLSAEWIPWSTWCLDSEVRVIDLASGTETTMAAGCDPAFSPDGRRIAFATPPQAFLSDSSTLNTQNAIRLINRQGQNGWNFATAGSDPNGLLVYAPSWSPDGQSLSYQRFVGYQALTDLNLTEIAGSFKGNGDPLAVGFGWLLPVRFASSGQQLAISQHNYDDARGFPGYDLWRVQVLNTNGEREVSMPQGSVQMQGSEVATLFRAQQAVWSPNGTTLAVQLPSGWQPNLPNDEPFGGEGAGEVWRWTPGNDPDTLLINNVDFASPLAWLP